MLQNTDKGSLIITGRVTLSNWIQFLISQKNQCHTWIIGCTTALVAIVISFVYMRGRIGDISYNLIFLAMGIIYFELKMLFTLKHASYLLTEILKDGLNDIDVVKNKWYGDENTMWERIKKHIPRGWYLISALTIFGGLVIFSFAGYLANHYASSQMINGMTISLISLVVSLGVGILAIGFAFLSIGTSKESDKKMKSLCTAIFMDISFIFEQNKNKIKAMPSSKIREYLIWQNRKLALRAVQLKDWVKPDFQEDLVKYFISGKNSMVKGLRYKKSKLSNTEKTDIRCTYDSLKQLNLKNKNIERPSDLIDDEEKK